MKSSTKMITLVAPYARRRFSPPGSRTIHDPAAGRNELRLLLPTTQLPALAGDAIPESDRPSWDGKWRIVFALPDTCDDACQSTLYATRQAARCLVANASVRNGLSRW